MCLLDQGASRNCVTQDGAAVIVLLPLKDVRCVDDWRL